MDDFYSSFRKKNMNLRETIKSLSSDYIRTIMIFRTIIIINDSNGRYGFNNKWDRIHFSHTNIRTHYYNNKIYHKFKSIRKIKDMRTIAISYTVDDILLDMLIILGDESIKHRWYLDITIQNIKPDQIPREIQGVYERSGMVHFWIGDCWFRYQ